MNATLEQLYDALQCALEECWRQRHAPVLGSQLRPAFLTQLERRGLSGSERDFGFKRFGDFVRSCPGVIVESRLGADIGVVPASERGSLGSLDLSTRRIKSDFWRHFVTFPSPGESRYFVPAASSFLTASGATPAGAIRIPAIEQHQQLDWRREFIQDLPPGRDADNLQASLDEERPFAAFGRNLSPELRRTWNQFLFEKVGSEIREWASRYDIPDEAWLEMPPAAAQKARDRLFALLRRVSTANLLQIRIPLGWLIEEDD